MRFLDMVGIVLGFPLIAWVIWGLVKTHRDAQETYSERAARMKKAQADYEAGIPPPKKPQFWRINDRVPEPYKFGK